MDILQFCTLMLLALRPRQGRQQYMDALLLATLQWQPYMDCLPSAAFHEEKLEATLSELQRAKEDDPTIVTVRDHQKHYRYLNRKPNLPRDIVLRTKQNTIQAYCGSSLLYHTPQRRYDAIDTHAVRWVGGWAGLLSFRAGGRASPGKISKTIWNK